VQNNTENDLALCVHAQHLVTAAVKMKQLLHLEMVYRKILCFKKHKDSTKTEWECASIVMRKLCCLAKKDKPMKQMLEEARNILQRQWTFYNPPLHRVSFNEGPSQSNSCYNKGNILEIHILHLAAKKEFCITKKTSGLLICRHMNHPVQKSLACILPELTTAAIKRKCSESSIICNAWWWVTETAMLIPYYLYYSQTSIWEFSPFLCQTDPQHIPRM